MPFDRSGHTPPDDPFPLGEERLLFSVATQAFPAEELDVLLLDPLPRVGSGRINLTFPIFGIPDGQSMVLGAPLQVGFVSRRKPARVGFDVVIRCCRARRCDQRIIPSYFFTHTRRALR